MAGDAALSRLHEVCCASMNTTAEPVCLWKNAESMQHAAWVLPSCPVLLGVTFAAEYVRQALTANLGRLAGQLT